MRFDTVSIDALLSDSGEALDCATRTAMEIGFSADFTDVVVHASPLTAFANRLLGSKAFTVGSHVFLGEGAPAPDSEAGKILIAHELAHVVQKRLGGSEAHGDVNEQAAELEAHLAAARVAGGGRYRCTVPLPSHTTSCWGEAGHYYTVYFVLQAAGLDAASAASIAFYSQMGDEVIELDAIQQGLRWSAMATARTAARIPGRGTGALADVLLRERMRVAKEIGRGLHCLTGADSDCETGWRASILERADSTTGDMTLGLAIHAFGDSFAHRDIDQPRKMYPPIIGHARELADDVMAGRRPSMERAHAPDHIDQRPDLYRQYGEELYAIVRHRWHIPLSKGIPLVVLSDALVEVSKIVGDEDQILKIRALSAKLCKQPIGRKYFPELKIRDGDDYKDCVSFERFMAIHKLPPTFLDQARGLAHAWSYLSAAPAPARQSSVANYKVAHVPHRTAKTYTVRPGDSLWAISKQHYGTTEKWSGIWNDPQNRALIGNDPDLIKPGMTLVIP